MSEHGGDDWIPGEAAEPLQVRDVLVTTFRTLGASPGSTLGLSAAVVVPSTLVGVLLQAVQFHLLREPLGNPMMAVTVVLAIGLISLAVALVSMLAMVSVVGAITHVTVETVLGRATTSGAAMRVSLARSLPLIGTVFFTGLVETIGAFLCVVPGMVAWVWLSVAVPACVAEKLGPLDAVQRSIELTEGHRLAVFMVGLVLSVALVTLLLCAVSPSLAVLIGQMQQTFETGVPVSDAQDPLAPLQLVSTALATLVQIGWTAIFSVMPAVMYVRLRGLREGVDANAVAQVFA